MIDTPPAVMEVYRRLLLARSGEERLLMGGEMFDAARTLARAGLLATGGAVDAGETRARLFMRLYGSDFDRQTAAKIAARLASSTRTSGDDGA